MNEEEQLKYYKRLYETETNPTIKRMLKQLIDEKERDISPGKPEEIPDDQVHSPVDEFGVASQEQGSKAPELFDPPPSQLDESPYTQTPQQRNLVSSINSEDSFETKGDNLEAGSSADNPIDSKTLSYEAQAQLPIGTWVTTAKGPHRINQGDKNWAKQMMQKTSGGKTTAPIADSKSSTGGTGKEKPATNKTGTVTTKPYYDTKDGVFKDHQTSTTIPADKAADFAGNHTIYKSSSLPEDQQQALSSARKDAQAKAAENKELYDDKSGPQYSRAGANAGKEVFEGAPIGQMPEVRALFQDKNNFVPISNLLKKAGKRDGLTADMTPQQVELMLTRVGDYIKSGSAEERAITRFRNIVNSIADSRYDEAQYQHLQQTGSL